MLGQKGNFVDFFFIPITRCNFLKHLLVLESIQFTGCQNSEIIKLYLTQMHLKKFKSTFFCLDRGDDLPKIGLLLVVLSLIITSDHDFVITECKYGENFLFPSTCNISRRPR